MNIKMVRTILTGIFLILLPYLIFGQNGEFKTYPNGLIYDDTSMAKLIIIADSINREFRNDTTSRIYYSRYQVVAHSVLLEEGDLGKAKTDLENNIPYNDFIIRYPEAITDSNLLFVPYRYTNRQGKEMTGFQSIIKVHTVEIAGSADLHQKSIKGTWFFYYSPGNDYSNEVIDAIYFTEDLKRQEIPAPYARMIQYSDYMIDTTSLIFKPGASYDGMYGFIKIPSKARRFLNYIHRETNMPRQGENDYRVKYKRWDTLRMSCIDKALAHQKKFRKLLDKAVCQALKSGKSNLELEEYTAKYYSKKAALELKRSRIVVGECSHDGRPRRHAVSIALLSAETGNWETFLRSHLDIMNDHFERVVDGSYAQSERKTYIKELEELDINVIELLTGISLRIGNPSRNHYYGDINRIGYALTETRFPAELENTLLAMIEDEKLDDLNRVMMYYLFLNYSQNLSDEETRNKNLDKLKEAARKLPVYLYIRLNLPR